jgi:hypothetical protein
MACWRDAKACKELGISPVTFAAYHKSHISKVMAMAVVGFAFKDRMDNGGEAMKLGFYQAQTFKVAQKVQRASVRQPDSLLKQNGPILCRKGDTYLVDCCVTRSTQGTIDDPKFALKHMFKFYVFPVLLRLVGLGGEYEGYTIIIQGDNAGRHGKSAYIKFVTEYCASKG